MNMLTNSVGRKARNLKADVVTVQKLLNTKIYLLIPLLPLKTDGQCGPITIALIKQFQRRVLLFKNPDGRVDPNGKTHKALLERVDLPKAEKSLVSFFDYLTSQVQTFLKANKEINVLAEGSKVLTEQDFSYAANLLGVEIATIKAVDAVESRGGGFDKNGKPKVLFEGHWFSKFTKGKFDKTHPTLSYPKWTKKHYKGGAAEYLRYLSAKKLDREAAMKSTSWGRFQIMGFNFKKAGYNSVTTFVNEMHTKESFQLNAFVKFLKSTGLDVKLSSKDWAGFARGYNGSAYAKNKYDIRLKQAYEAFKNEE